MPCINPHQPVLGPNCGLLQGLLAGAEKPCKCACCAAATFSSPQDLLVLQQACYVPGLHSQHGLKQVLLAACAGVRSCTTAAAASKLASFLLLGLLAACAGGRSCTMAASVTARAILHSTPATACTSTHAKLQVIAALSARTCTRAMLLIAAASASTSAVLQVRPAAHAAVRAAAACMLAASCRVC